MGIQVCLISWINFGYKKNGGKKICSCKSKASISCITIWKRDGSANNKKTCDYYEYPSLFHFKEEA